MTSVGREIFGTHTETDVS